MYADQILSDMTAYFVGFTMNIMHTFYELYIFVDAFLSLVQFSLDACSCTAFEKPFFTILDWYVRVNVRYTICLVYAMETIYSTVSLECKRKANI